jgi:hypothetical protein
VHPLSGSVNPCITYRHGTWVLATHNSCSCATEPLSGVPQSSPRSMRCCLRWLKIVSGLMLPANLRKTLTDSFRGTRPPNFVTYRDGNKFRIGASGFAHRVGVGPTSRMTRLRSRWLRAVQPVSSLFPVLSADRLKFLRRTRADSVLSCLTRRMRLQFCQQPQYAIIDIFGLVANTIQKVGRFVKQPTQIDPVLNFQLT